MIPSGFGQTTMKSDEDTFGRILEESFNEIFIFDAETYRFLRVNRGARQNIGYSMDELKELTPLDIKPLHTPETFAAIVAPLLSGEKKKVVFETIHRRKDGTDYDTSIHLQLTEYRNRPAFVAIILDITEQRKRRDELRDRELRLQAILNTAVEGIITIDEQGHIESFNAAAESMFGYAVAEVIGQNVRVLMPTPYRDEHDDYLANYRETGETKIIGIGREVVGRKKDGTTFPIELSVSVVELPGRRIFTGIVRDITDRKQAEQALRRQGQALDTGATAIAFAGLDGNLTYVNRAFTRMWGYDETDNLVGRPITDMSSSVDDATEVVKGLHENGEWIGERVGKRKDGTFFEMQISASMVMGDDNQPVAMMASFVDLSRVREAEERASQAERLAAIGQVVTSMAHESRNFLQRVRNAVEFLEELVADNKEALMEVARIQNAERGLENLLEELRQYAAPMKLDTERCSVQKIWRQAWSQVAATNTRAKHARFDEPAGELQMHCDCDTFRIGQVFRNLFENSLSACGDSPCITVDCTNGDGRLRIAVRDNGSGLSLEQQRNVFEPFFTTKSKGTGLGMAIVKRIVEAHGGSIRVEDEYTDGAGFIVTLPIRQA